MGTGKAPLSELQPSHSCFTVPKPPGVSDLDGMVASGKLYDKAVTLFSAFSRATHAKTSLT
jgi:hypothetical protein